MRIFTSAQSRAKWSADGGSLAVRAIAAAQGCGRSLHQLQSRRQLQCARYKSAALRRPQHRELTRSLARPNPLIVYLRIHTMPAITGYRRTTNDQRQMTNDQRQTTISQLR